MQMLGLSNSEGRAHTKCGRSRCACKVTLSLLGRELLAKTLQGVIAVNRSVLYLGSILILISSPIVFACALPSLPGVKICTPASDQVVTYPTQITAAVTPQADHKITAIAVYVDENRTLLQNGVSEISHVDRSLSSGTHHLVVNAWDETGHLYSSRRSFAVVGACAPPAPGILFCSPEIGSWQPTNGIAGDVAARGDGVPITRMQVFIDGYLMQDSANSSATFSAGFGNAGTHTLGAKAWDKIGHVYTATTKFKTYYDGICSPKGCAPGVFIQSPARGESVTTTFPLRVDVQKNPAPITGMKAYLDGHLVATSFGPTMISNVTTSPGQHELNVQAWDTAGSLYRTVTTVTVR
jgi:Big-like domain-containing protein